jgi:TPR repeat protein
MKPTLAAALLAAFLPGLAAAADSADDIFALCQEARTGIQTRLAACTAAAIGRPDDVALRYAYARAQQRAGDEDGAAENYERAAEAGHAAAQAALGSIYMRGRAGAAPDRALALRWYERAASQGHVSAQAVTGFLYFNGVGERQDFARAASWMKKAAWQGASEAQFGLGALYAQGKGVQTDPVQALMWFSVAAGKMPPGPERDAVLRYRASVAGGLSPDEIDEARRLATEWRALEGR